PRQSAPIPCSEPAPIVMTRSPPWTVLPMMVPTTGGILMLSQFGFALSGFFGSGHFGNEDGLQALTSRLGGFGHGIVAQHAWMLMSGGVGHLSLHAGQPGGAPVCGHTSLQAGFF